MVLVSSPVPLCQSCGTPGVKKTIRGTTYQARPRDSQGFPAAMDGNSCVLLRFLRGVYLGLTNLITAKVSTF
jgi:hypothetical protein